MVETGRGPGKLQVYCMYFEVKFESENLLHVTTWWMALIVNAATAVIWNGRKKYICSYRYIKRVGERKRDQIFCYIKSRVFNEKTIKSLNYIVQIFICFRVLGCSEVESFDIIELRASAQ